MAHVIAGAGPAGIVAAETLTGIDPGAKIIVIGDEPEPPYSRMALPYLLAGAIGEEGTHLRRGEGRLAGRGIELRRGRVASLDPASRKLGLEDGATLDYDTLLIATGSSAIRPPIPGADLAGVVNCWTLADARAIAAAARPGARVTLMGAGFIGCIVLEALAARGVVLTVIEAEDRMLPRMMDDAGGEMIKRWCERKGVTIRTGVRVDRIEKGESEALTLTLDDGSNLAADLVVAATGVRANTGFLAGSGLRLGDGITVDDHLASSADGVWAAGDVAEGFDFSTGGRAVHAIQPTAAEHGRIAALNMAGRPARYSGSLSMNVLNTLGLISSSFGRWQGVSGGDTVVRSDPDRSRYLKLAFDGDVIVGALALGLTEHVGVLRGLIQSRVPLGPWKDRLTGNPFRLMEAYLARTQGGAAGL